MLIDSLILGIFGWLLGLFFAEQFMHLGGWGRLLGFCISLFYFGLMNSALFGGQTVGKRIARIRLTDNAGTPLSIGKSCARYVILGTPYFLNGAPIPLNLVISGFGVVLSVAVFGLGGSIVYLIIFNKRTRQSLHDLIVSSFVVRAGQELIPKLRIWKGHYIVVALILVISAVLPFVAGLLAQKEFFRDILIPYQTITKEPEISAALLTAGQTIFWGGNGRSAHTQLSATVRVNRKIADKAAEADKIARIILQSYPKSKSNDSIYINVIEGYDIGIASWSRGEAYNYPPQEWESRINHH